MCVCVCVYVCACPHHIGIECVPNRRLRRHIQHGRYLVGQRGTQRLAGGERLPQATKCTHVALTDDVDKSLKLR